jgi:pimeloyl-ACP methyl ester carboxylesterase
MSDINRLPKKQNNITSVSGFVAHDPVNDVFVISFRGTQSKIDIFRDINYHLTPVLSICATCEASYGFWKAWNGVKEGVIQALDTNNREQKRIIVVGHSLGGAVASVATAELRKLGYNADVVSFNDSSEPATS